MSYVVGGQPPAKYHGFAAHHKNNFALDSAGSSESGTGNSLQLRPLQQSRGVRVIQRSDSEEKLLREKKEKQRNYCQKLQIQAEEFRNRQKQEKLEPEKIEKYFPWGKDILLRDDSGKLISNKGVTQNEDGNFPGTLSTAPQSPGLYATLPSIGRTEYRTRTDFRRLRPPALNTMESLNKEPEGLWFSKPKRSPLIATDITELVRRNPSKDSWTRPVVPSKAASGSQSRQQLKSQGKDEKRKTKRSWNWALFS